MKKTANFTRFLRFLTLFWIVLACVAPIARAQQSVLSTGAVSDTIYRIEGVKVDVTGNAVTARDRAVEQAQQEAFRILLGRLTVGSGQKTIPTSSDLAKMVQDIDIVDEKVSANRYSAICNIRFRPEATRAFMTGQSLAVAETVRAPILVIPVWIVDGRKKLWDVDNPWRDAWRQQAGKDPLQPMLVPEGAVEDVALGTAEELMAGRPDVIEAYQVRYKADTVLVAVATQRPEDRRLAIDVRDYGRMMMSSQGLVDSQKMTVPPMADETDAALYLRGVMAVQDRLRDQWKQQTAVNLDAGQRTLLVSVPVGGIEDWIAVQRRLNNQKNLLRADVLALNTRAVRLLIHHYGTIDQLRVVLGQQGLELAPYPKRLQPVLLPAAGTAPAPVAGMTVPQELSPTEVAAAPDLPGAGPAPALAAEPEWMLVMRNKTP